MLPLDGEKLGEGRICGGECLCVCELGEGKCGGRTIVPLTFSSSSWKISSSDLSSRSGILFVSILGGKSGSALHAVGSKRENPTFIPLSVHHRGVVKMRVREGEASEVSILPFQRRNSRLSMLASSSLPPFCSLSGRAARFPLPLFPPSWWLDVWNFLEMFFREMEGWGGGKPRSLQREDLSILLLFFRNRSVFFHITSLIIAAASETFFFLIQQAKYRVHLSFGIVIMEKFLLLLSSHALYLRRRLRGRGSFPPFSPPFFPNWAWSLTSLSLTLASPPSLNYRRRKKEIAYASSSSPLGWRIGVSLFVLTLSFWAAPMLPSIFFSPILFFLENPVLFSPSFSHVPKFLSPDATSSGLTEKKEQDSRRGGMKKRNCETQKRKLLFTFSLSSFSRKPPPPLIDFATFFPSLLQIWKFVVLGGGGRATERQTISRMFATGGGGESAHRKFFSREVSLLSQEKNSSPPLTSFFLREIELFPPPPPAHHSLFRRRPHIR